MEKIKFRGKRADNGDFVYGNFFYWKRYRRMIPMIGMGIQNGSVYGKEVIPESVVALKETKDGIEIYQGDNEPVNFCPISRGREIMIIIEYLEARLKHAQLTPVQPDIKTEVGNIIDTRIEDIENELTRYAIELTSLQQGDEV